MEEIIIGVDYGEGKSGVAKLDTRIGLPQPIGIFKNRKLIEFLLSEKSNVSKIVVGLPLSLKGKLTDITFQSIRFAEKLHKSLNKKVFLIDERFSSSQSRSLFKLDPKKRRFKDVKDAFSACLILENFYHNPSVAYIIDGKFRTFPKKVIENIKGKSVLISNKKYKLGRWIKEPEKLLFQTKDPYYFYILTKASLDVLFCDFEDIPDDVIAKFDLIL